MTRPRLLLNAFTMNTVTHVAYGAWRREDTRQTEFHTLDPWIELVTILERGGFDAVFFADVVGLYDDFNGGWDTHVAEGLQIPNHDPSALVSALAAATEHLGIVITSSVLQDHPFSFARKISTLDHLSGGRIGWNVVTSALRNSARNFDLPDRVEHDGRYEWAEEYTEVVYKLWEGSWDDGALIRDRVRGIHADPAKVHKINHRSARYSVEGPHLSAPSPQRTPVLFQAGTSETGRAFAARHAEGVFITQGSPRAAEQVIRATRDQAVAAGRERDDIKFFQGLTVIVGSTEEEARRKAEDLDSSFSVDGLLAHRSGSIGIDFGGLPTDTPIGELAGRVDGTKSTIEGLIRAADGRTDVTIADFIRHKQQDTRIVGTPEQIVDELERWQDAGVDGINLQYLVTPGSFADFADHVVPELRTRGLALPEYEPGTLRHKLFGRDDTLPQSHPARRWRGAFSTTA
ncbi:NtaA/DmoA family FMN-dependent monooxygenase [Nocardia cerradoensis]|uniref:Dimethyl-sulfide monooxygenase n=1 Tax=Nocardia cerradoensis TaxID=85688 RepID=A0A231HDR6_9NOCA|nr:NtaA/DmoA family FMN-dependent monooxygenase [Nocardia cerradoensis]NKY45770.1 NtaA/DmoA family FMN-dependent monooxygenase [Nocardia cerradoensis]OXR46908.1 Dimethyl-sulfide monooxygenase [Nocardia cerradoensis]